MPSPFDALWAGVQPVFDGTLGEDITIEPKPAGSGRRIAVKVDPADLPFDVVGIFRDAAAVDHAPRPGSGQSDGPDILVGKTTADFTKAQFTDATLPRDGWTLVLKSRDGAPRYAIGPVKPQGTARVVAVLTFQGNTA